VPGRRMGGLAAARIGLGGPEVRLQMIRFTGSASGLAQLENTLRMAGQASISRGGAGAIHGIRGGSQQNFKSSAKKSTQRWAQREDSDRIQLGLSSFLCIVCLFAAPKFPLRLLSPRLPAAERPLSGVNRSHRHIKLIPAARLDGTRQVRSTTTSTIPGVLQFFRSESPPIFRSSISRFQPARFQKSNRDVIVQARPAVHPRVAGRLPPQ